MKKIIIFIFILLAITGVNGRGRYLSDYSIPVNDTALSNFDGDTGTGGEWIKSAGDSIRYDLVNVQNSTRSIKMYAHNGTFTSMDKTFATPVNMSGRILVSLNYYEPWSSAQYGDANMLIILSTNTGFTHYYSWLILKTKVLQNISGWYHITVSLNDVNMSITGSPNIASIAKIRIRVNTLSGDRVVTMDQLHMHATSLSKGRVCIGIDDGNVSIYTHALPIFNATGIKPTCFIIGSSFNTAGHLSFAQGDSLYRDRFEIGSHTWSHLYDTSLTPTGVDTECTKNIALLRGRQYRTYSLFAYPYGNHNKSGDSIVNRYHTFLRCVNQPTSIINTGGNAYYWPTPLYSMSNFMGGRIMNEVGPPYNPTWKACIDSAIAAKMCINFIFHSFNKTASYEVTDTAQFDSICTYLAGQRDAGVLDVGGMGAFLKFAPDSCIIKKSTSSTSTTYTLNDSLSTDADSMKILRYDSTGGSWILEDSTALLPGGALFSFTKTGLTLGVKYFYRLVGRADSGTFDSTLAEDSVDIAKWWNSTGSTDANLVANYSPTTALTIYNIIILDSMSAIEWTPTDSIKVTQVLVNTKYTGSINLNDKYVSSLRLNRSQLINGGGIINIFRLDVTGINTIFEKAKNFTFSTRLDSINGTFTSPDSMVSSVHGKQDTVTCPQDTFSYVYFRDQNFKNIQYLNTLMGGGNNTKLKYLTFDSCRIKNWFNQDDTIRANWIKIESSDSAIFNKPIIVRDSIVYMPGCIPVARSGSQVESTTGYTLTVKLNGFVNTPKIINKSKIKYK